MEEKYTEQERAAIDIWNGFASAKKITKTQIEAFAQLDDTSSKFLQKYISEQMIPGLDEHDQVHCTKVMEQMAAIIERLIAGQKELLAQGRDADIDNKKQPNLNSIAKKVKKFIIPANKLHNRLPDLYVTIDQWNNSKMCEVGNGNVDTKVMIFFDETKVTITGDKYMAAYDKAVYNAVISLYQAGNEYITPKMVYRTMSGRTDGEAVNENSLKKVANSLNKARFTNVHIDYTDEAKMYNKNIEKTVYEGYLLNAEKIMVKAGGQDEVEAYKIIRKPILYEYAQISGQIYSVEMKLLNTSNRNLRSTDENIVIREYLIRQIEWMKSPKGERNQHIKYSPIFTELEIKEPTTKKFFDIRKNIKAILDEWVKQDYIVDFEEYKDKNKYEGVKILNQKRLKVEKCQN